MAFVERVQKEFNPSGDDSGFNSQTPSEDSDLDNLIATLDNWNGEDLDPQRNRADPPETPVHSPKSNPNNIVPTEVNSKPEKPPVASNRMPKREMSTEEILEENRKLKEDRLCKICLDSNKEVIFIPCGHYLACLNCGLNFQTCPVCRAKISSIVKTYMT